MLKCTQNQGKNQNKSDACLASSSLHTKDNQLGQVGTLDGALHVLFVQQSNTRRIGLIANSQDFLYTIYNMSMNKIRTIGFLLAIAGAIFGALDCKNSLTSSDLNNIVFPAKVSYSGQVDPLFIEGCAFSGCHDATTAAQQGIGYPALDSYYDARESDPLIWIGGDTLRSHLVWGIEGKNGVARMPLNRPPLDTNQINGLKRWILQGAQNN
jgi:hypothetical protein